MAWVYLLIAGVLEVLWAFTMKQSQGFTRLVPSAITIVASGQGVSSSPVSTSERPTTLCRKKGSETIASIWAQKEQIEVQMESENSGMRSRSTGSNGTGS